MPSASAYRLAAAPAETSLSFSQNLSMFVPSLSWQMFLLNVRWQNSASSTTKRHCKREASAPRPGPPHRQGPPREWSSHIQYGRPKRQTVVFFEFSLCLSRVCLGKMIVFIYKWLNKWRFSHESYPPLIFDRFRPPRPPNCKSQLFLY